MGKLNHIDLQRVSSPTPTPFLVHMSRKSFAPIPEIDFITKRRLMAKIDTGEPDKCWHWTGATSKGYGRFKIGQSIYLAHRVVYQIHYGGAMPQGMVVMHTCDNPSCCNPAHLRLGTYTENVLDMDAKGRRNNVRGEDCATAKLTEEQVIAIRKSKLSERAIARIYGMAKSSIHAIRSGQTWQHLEAR